MKPRRPLRRYQKDALQYINIVGHSALFIDMRLGKTLTVIRWIKLHPEIERVLIVCPYSAFDSWKQELRMEHPEEKLIELTGTHFQRHISMMGYGKWFIINKEGHLSLPEMATRRWDVLILDESTFIKSPKTKVANFFVNNFRNVPYRFILTGTPAPESELDYFQQLQFLDPSILGFRNYWEFRQSHFSESYHKFFIHKKSREWLSKRLSERCFFLSRKDAGLKNIKIYEKRKVELSEEAQKVYDTLAEEFLLEVEGKIVASTIFATTRFIWMRRLFGGFVDGKMIFDAKYQELKSLLNGELKNDSVVIWCNFIQELKYLHAKLSGSELIYGGIKHKERDMVLHRFQSGKTRLLLAQPECFKHGTNLSISDTMIYYSTPLGLESRMQSEDRIINLTKGSALIIDLVVDKTIETSILRSLKMKETKQEMVRRIVRRLQRETKKS